MYHKTNSVTDVPDKLSFLWKAIFLLVHFSRWDNTGNLIVAPWLNYRRRWFEGVEKDIMLYILNKIMYFDWLQNDTLFLGGFVLVTSAFWHWQKLFSVVVVENNTDIIKDLLKKTKNVFLLFSIDRNKKRNSNFFLLHLRILQFSECHSINMLQS